MSTYAAPADVRARVAGTDAGTGTCAQLQDSQLTDAITQASNRVDVRTGQTWNAADPAFPPLIKDVTVDLAVYFATLTYMKGKALGPDDAVRLRYADAMQVLSDIGAGRIDPNPQSGQDAPVGPKVINQLPNVFVPADSNTRVVAGQVFVDTPPDTLSSVGTNLPLTGDPNELP